MKPKSDPYVFAMCNETSAQSGITLRDYFAIKIASGMANRLSIGDNEIVLQGIVDTSFKMADMMIGKSNEE